MKPFHAIAAMADNRVIGNGGEIPWHLPDDFRWFKEKTLGHAIVMGRKTYESIGKPLPKRKNIVITRQELEIEGCDVIHSLDELTSLGLEDREIFIIGGGEIYQTALPQCSDLWISHVKGDFTGDAFFPEFESSFEAVETVRDFPEFRVTHYQRKTT
ncbi:dihydrofolate reductase [Rubellicoccus peritrichatus]|uniref:Dihydrofolate reductase n=1 Tax=Rubellicoccus peritrichatus TaxID=3080537 RepID=A0AAQ3LAT9_9BACT|nr:dihydrofolate reductase [Puniceicoccus sp. CR14]WOO42719.1 dihydrofolate reductase [Puniceicoccus sp. CR14]